MVVTIVSSAAATSSATAAAAGTTAVLVSGAKRLHVISIINCLADVHTYVKSRSSTCQAYIQREFHQAAELRVKGSKVWTRQALLVQDKHLEEMSMSVEDQKVMIKSC
ncbi:hypothetical protein BDA96_06G015500 [Sorghum bicolor]|uniref:Uncharacterized protein n=2 Tax=Sorghum bicolor TaxID=4558 RepID=A0A921QQ16_SORBI|nr:hypothetical protein BDA96_06G015500 [Sorghum bicolor]KXG25801.1 hypothetical protein SORBI_3006G014300 [Sorghum bicolor]